MSSSPSAAVTLLDAWLRLKSSTTPGEAFLHDKAAVLERIVQILLPTKGSNPIKLAAYYEELIQTYRNILFQAANLNKEIEFYENKIYCVGNNISKRLLYNYLESMNVYISIVLDNRILHDPLADIGVESFEHIDRAKNYAEVLLGSELVAGDKELSGVDIELIIPANSPLLGEISSGSSIRSKFHLTA